MMTKWGLRIECEKCVLKPSHPPFKNYAAWINHLLSEEHQKRLEELKYSLLASEPGFSVVIKGNLQPRNVLKYFSPLGIVTEFYRDPKFSIVTISVVDEEDKDGFNFDSEHIIDGRPITLYPRSKMTQDNWNDIKGNRQNRRTITVEGPLEGPEAPLPQAEIRTGPTTSGGSQAPSVSGNRDGPRKKKRMNPHNRKKAKATGMGVSADGPKT